jgi:hypothetical protein
VPESVIVLTPMKGERQTYPAPTHAVSWLDGETLLLEFQGWRYGLNLETGEAGSYHDQSRTVTEGRVSPDGEFVAQWRSWGPTIWDYGSTVSGVWDWRGKANLLPEIARRIDAKTANISERSFWLRGRDHPHHLCLGIGRLTTGPGSNMVTRYRDCETVVVDVKEMIVTRRIPGAFVGPASDGKHVVVWQDGQLKFIKL